MSIRPESPGEIYEDKNGNRWLVMSLCNEPTVKMQRIVAHWSEGQPVPQQQEGGITGLMWDGFKKVLDAQRKKPA